jgi:hypothetical protein
MVYDCAIVFLNFQTQQIVVYKVREMPKQYLV